MTETSIKQKQKEKKCLKSGLKAGIHLSLVMCTNAERPRVVSCQSLMQLSQSQMAAFVSSDRKPKLLISNRRQSVHS